MPDGITIGRGKANNALELMEEMPGFGGET